MSCFYSFLSCSLFFTFLNLSPLFFLSWLLKSCQATAVCVAEKRPKLFYCANASTSHKHPYSSTYMGMTIVLMSVARCNTRLRDIGDVGDMWNDHHCCLGDMAVGDSMKYWGPRDGCSRKFLLHVIIIMSSPYVICGEEWKIKGAWENEFSCGSWRYKNFGDLEVARKVRLPVHSNAIILLNMDIFPMSSIRSLACPSMNREH